ncbi:monocyte to macrophage differentiation factor 2-like isoform X1 [Lytechinus variegatus]|uniref:monocyte to macrophage differentiation factor 2-like isoform X1 n=1 Tax=Lytechinus variegatus TaxID=7654 RepID=UPI001BB1E0C4|nr:monocyte to macrophage differentiation factor 2-like isoform X1 [Lytechinus variegatus]
MCGGDIKWKNNPAKPHEAYVPTNIEHIANIITHGLCIIPSLYASHDLIQEATTYSQKTSAIIFGLALLLLFSISTLFHLVSWSGLAKKLRFYLHISDRAIIYLYIAASYTPWLTLCDVGYYGNHLRWVMWFLASLGILYSYCFYEKYKRLETLFYVILGTVPALVVLESPLKNGLYELALGGIIYICGVVFFKSDGIIPCAHAIWHVFVVMGAYTHLNAIQKYLIGCRIPGVDPDEPSHLPDCITQSL